MTPSVVVYDLNFRRPNFCPYEANAPLIVDADAVLTFPVVLQCLKVISGWCLQEIQCLRGVKLREFPLGDLGQSPEPTRALALVQRQGVLALERLDHLRIVLRAA